MLNSKDTLWYKGMVNPPPVLETVPIDTWLEVSWEEFLTFADAPTLAVIVVGARQQ